MDSVHTHLLTPTRKNIEGIIWDSVSAVVCQHCNVHFNNFSKEKKQEHKIEAYYLSDCFTVLFKLNDHIFNRMTMGR